MALVWLRMEIQKGSMAALFIFTKEILFKRRRDIPPKGRGGVHLIHNKKKERLIINIDKLKRKLIKR